MNAVGLPALDICVSVAECRQVQLKEKCQNTEQSVKLSFKT